MLPHGFARIAVCSPVVSVGNPDQNTDRIIDMLNDPEIRASDMVLFPELCVSSYTCGDLFLQSTLLDSVEKNLFRLAHCPSPSHQLIFVGAPIRIGTGLYNCAVAISKGSIIGIVPKQNIPQSSEFYEGRWFSAANGTEPKFVQFTRQDPIPFGIDLIFSHRGHKELSVFAEICEDLWLPLSPSSYASLAGATVAVNLSASPETVQKCDYRRDLVKVQSGKTIMAYAYASAGPSESTTDLVFSGHCLVAENWKILAESSYIGDGTLNFGSRQIIADIDYQMLSDEKRKQRSFGEMGHQINRTYRHVGWGEDKMTYLRPSLEKTRLKRKIDGNPFVPLGLEEKKKTYAAVFDIQCAAFAKRWQHIGFCDLSIGVSGGSDSTHTLSVLERTCKAINQPLTKIQAISMPGFGTTTKTRNIGENLCQEMGVPFKVIDIRPIAFEMMKAMGHRPFGLGLDGCTWEEFTGALSHVPVDRRKDLVFENIQARVRTNILMGHGFMVGTGDMSEAGEGWTTYGGDHLSNYNPNIGVPKTLVKELLQYAAFERYPMGPIRDLLWQCSQLKISPELLPTSDGETIEQGTEDTIGSYDLIDFFMFYVVRYGFSPQKVLFLAEQAFRDLPKELGGDEAERKRVLKIFYQRFFANQFKRSCVPDGPKVGSLCLSPRGDWRMPSDADSRLWLEDSCDA